MDPASISILILKVFHYSFIIFGNLILALFILPVIFSNVDWSDEIRIREMLIAPIRHPFRNLPNIQVGLFAFQSDFIMGWSLLCIADAIVEAVIKHGT